LPGSGQPAPGYAAQGYQAPRQYTANVPQAQSAAGGSVHKVQPGQTIYALSRIYGVKPMTIAAHNGISAPYHIQVGQQVRIPANGGAIAAAPARKPLPDYRAASNKVVPAKAGPERKVSIKTAREPAPAAPRKVAQRKPYRGPLPTPEPRTSSKFRWPVKGKVISKFGRKSNGARNDGINISVPPGTTVRAAENGVVAYAGSELKGYGNLVLVRHSDNWVTAYAHNSDLLVQRGDRVKRGDVIARAGRTGSVSSPQVHFEIRRGAKAVDPISHMTPTNVASN